MSSLQFYLNLFYTSVSFIFVQLLFIHIISQYSYHHKNEFFHISNHKDEANSNSSSDDSDDKSSEESKNEQDEDSFDTKYKEYYENLKKENNIIENNYSSLYKKVTGALNRRTVFPEKNKFKNLIKNTYDTYGKRRIYIKRSHKVRHKIIEKINYIYSNFYDPYYNRKYFFGSFYDYKFILMDPRNFFKKKGTSGAKKLRQQKKKETLKYNRVSPVKMINKDVFYNILLAKYPKHTFEFLNDNQVRIYQFLRNIITHALHNIYFEVTGRPYSSSYIYWGNDWFRFVKNHFVSSFPYKNLVININNIFSATLFHLFPTSETVSKYPHNYFAYTYKWVRQFFLNRPIIHRVYETLIKNRISIYKQTLPLQQRKKGYRYRTVGKYRVFKPNLTRIPFDRTSPYLHLNHSIFGRLNKNMLLKSLLYAYSKYPIYKASVSHYSKDFKNFLKLYKARRRNILRKRKKFFRKIKPSKNKSYFFLRLRKIVRSVVFRPTYWKQTLLYPLLRSWIIHKNPIKFVHKLYRDKSFYGKLKLDVILASKAILNPKAFETDHKKDIDKLKFYKKKFIFFIAKDLYGYQKVGQSYFYYISDFFRKDRLFKKLSTKSKKRRLSNRKKKFKKQFFNKDYIRNPYRKQVYLNSLFKAIIISHLQKFSGNKNNNYNIFYKKLPVGASHLRTLYGFLYKTDKNRSFTTRHVYNRRKSWIKVSHDDSFKKILKAAKKKPKKRVRKYNSFKRYLKLKLFGIYNNSLEDWYQLIRSFGGYGNPTRSKKNDIIIRLPHHLKGFAISNRLTAPREKKKGVHPYRYSRVKKRVIAFRSIFRSLFNFMNSRRRVKNRLSKEATRMNKTRYSSLNNFHFFMNEIISYYKTIKHKCKFKVLLIHPTISSLFKNKSIHFLMLNGMYANSKEIHKLYGGREGEQVYDKHITISTFITIFLKNATEYCFEAMAKYLSQFLIHVSLTITVLIASLSDLFNNLFRINFVTSSIILNGNRTFIHYIQAICGSIILFFKVLKCEINLVPIIYLMLNLITLNVFYLIMLFMMFIYKTKHILASLLNIPRLLPIIYKTLILDKRYGRNYNSSIIINLLISFAPQLYRRNLLFILNFTNTFINIFTYVKLAFFYFKKHTLSGYMLRISDLAFYHLYYIGVFRLDIPKGWMVYFYYWMSNYVEDIHLDLDIIYSYPILRQIYSPIWGIYTLVNIIIRYTARAFYGEWFTSSYLIPFREYYLFFFNKFKPVITILNNIILWPLSVVYHIYQGNIQNLFYEIKQSYYGFTELALYRTIMFLNKSEVVAKHILLYSLYLYNIVLYGLSNLYTFFVWFLGTFHIMRTIINIVIQQGYPRSNIGGYIYYASTEEELAGTMYMIIMITIINAISVYFTYVRPLDFLSNIQRIYYIIREPTSLGFRTGDSHLDLKGDHLIRDSMESLIARFWYHRIKLISKLYYSYKDLAWNLYGNKLEALVDFQYKIDTLVYNKTNLYMAKFLNQSLGNSKVIKTKWVKTYPYITIEKKWTTTYNEYLHSIIYSAVKRAKMFEFRPNIKQKQRLFPFYKIIKNKMTINEKDPIVNNYIKGRLSESDTIERNSFLKKLLKSLVNKTKGIRYIGKHWNHQYHNYYALYSTNWWTSLTRFVGKLFSYCYSYFITTTVRLLKYTVIFYSLLLSIPVVLLLPFEIIIKNNIYVRTLKDKINGDLVKVINIKTHIEYLLHSGLDRLQYAFVTIFLIFVRASIVFLHSITFILSKIAYWHNVGLDEFILKAIFEKTTELYILSSGIRMDRNKISNFYQSQLWLWYYLIKNIIKGITYADSSYFKEAYRALYILFGFSMYYVIVAPTIYIFIYMPLSICVWFKQQVLFILFGDEEMYRWLLPNNSILYYKYRYNEANQRVTAYKLFFDDFYGTGTHGVFKGDYYEYKIKKGDKNI